MSVLAAMFQTHGGINDAVTDHSLKESLDLNIVLNEVNHLSERIQNIKASLERDFDRLIPLQEIMSILENYNSEIEGIFLKRSVEIIESQFGEINLSIKFHKREKKRSIKKKLYLFKDKLTDLNKRLLEGFFDKLDIIFDLINRLSKLLFTRFKETLILIPNIKGRLEVKNGKIWNNLNWGKKKRIIENTKSLFHDFLNDEYILKSYDRILNLDKKSANPINEEIDFNLYLDFLLSSKKESVNYLETILKVNEIKLEKTIYKIVDDVSDKRSLISRNRSHLYSNILLTTINAAIMPIFLTLKTHSKFVDSIG